MTGVCTCVGTKASAAACWRTDRTELGPCHHAPNSDTSPVASKAHLARHWCAKKRGCQCRQGTRTDTDWAHMAHPANQEDLTSLNQKGSHGHASKTEHLSLYGSDCRASNRAVRKVYTRVDTDGEWVTTAHSWTTRGMYTVLVLALHSTNTAAK